MTMDRRQFIATVGLSLSVPLSGCLNAPTVAVTPSDGISATDANCGIVDQPLSARLTDENGECVDAGGTPSLEIENQRDERVTVTVDLTGGGGFSETYTLAPTERVVEQDTFEVAAGINGTVTIGSEAWPVRWPGRSCYRYGIALLSQGPRIGWVEPLAGIADTLHACYPGTEADVRIESKGKARTVTVTITDLCAGTTVTETHEIGAGEWGRVEGELVSGGMYDVTVDVESGNSKTYEYHENCRDVWTTLHEDGTISFHQRPIY